MIVKEEVRGCNPLNKRRVRAAACGVASVAIAS